jgi:hypothetical protein
MELSTMANQISVSDSGTVQVAIQQLGDVQVQISRTAGALGTSGYSGQQGPQGISGYSGASGISGVSGASFVGSSGVSGYSGTSGYSGANGSAGASGASGASGYSGGAGSAGASGISGYSGQNGASASSGYSGVSGYSGTNGSAGASGVSGYSGTNGANGASGLSGYSGETGPQGTSGYSGQDGAQGTSGYSGQDGASGVSGVSGFSGLDGASGYSGIDGASGVSGFSGAAGTATPGGANTEVQYNDNGSLNGSSAFVFDNTSNTVTIANLTVNDGVVTDPSLQVTPAGTTVGTIGTSNSAMTIVTEYGDSANLATVHPIAFMRSRGNSTTLASSSNNDSIFNMQGYAYNGNNYSRAISISATAPNAANTTQNAWTAGNFFLETGNPGGNFSSTTNASQRNLFTLSPTGDIQLLAGAPGTTYGGILYRNYGGNASNSATGQFFTFDRARGNRDSNVALQNGDQLGGIRFRGYNGNAFFTTRSAGLAATANTTYGAIANGASVPTDIRLHTMSNTTEYSTYFRADGSVSMPGNLSISNNFSASGNISTNNSINVNSGNVNLYANGSVTTLGDISVNNNVNLYANGDISTTGGINVNNVTTLDNGGNITAGGSASFQAQDNTSTLTLVVDNKVNVNAIRVERYSNASNAGGIGTFSIYRTGYDAGPAPVENGDNVFNLDSFAYSDSGNIFVYTGGFKIDVATNDQAGNITTVATYNQGTYPGTVNFNYDTINFNGNINYTKSYGQFTSNVTQTNGNVGNPMIMTLNNDEGSNGVSIVSGSQITTARTGLYNLQFSAQIEKTDAGTDEVEIWLTKNGAPVANSAPSLIVTIVPVGA